MVCENINCAHKGTIFITMSDEVVGKLCEYHAREFGLVIDELNL